MAKVKIGNKEYEFESLSTLDLKNLDEGRDKNKAKKEGEDKLTDYEWTFYMILYAIKKFNLDIKMSLNEFMDSFPLIDIWIKVEEIFEITGLNEKNLTKGIGKK